MESACVALVIAYAVFLAGSYLKGAWLIAPGGGGVATDFVNVWAAGRLALAGHAAAAYDWPTHKLAEEQAVHHPFDGYFGWHYPPTFLFVAALLSLLPYAVAFATWTLASFAAYAAAIRAIIGDRVGYLLAAAFPAVVANFFVGQNGFFSASLIGGALAVMERRPLLAGALIGLLTYKPHLGLLFPIALVAGRHWRAAVAAGVVAAVMAAAAWLAFGEDSWRAFFANIGSASHAFLSEGLADWSKLQTGFGLIRTLGGSEAVAWAAQGLMALAAAAVVALLWRSSLSYEIKSAALGTGAMLATPYLYTYDLAVLAVPIAFLLRLGRARGFLPHELASIGCACVLILIFIVPALKVPVGFAAVLIIAALIGRRALKEASSASPAR